MTGKKNLKLKNRIDEMNKLNQFLNDFSRQYSLDPQICQSIHLSLEEIFTNIVQYGFKNKQKHEINFYFTPQKKSLTVSIEDEGIPFNPLGVAKPDLNLCLRDRKVGGMGIHLVRSLMDFVSYERKNNKNIITIEKKFEQKNKQGGTKCR